jgi:hypothetical protein
LFAAVNGCFLALQKFGYVSFLTLYVCLFLFVSHFSRGTDATALLMSITCQPYFMLVPEYFSTHSFVLFCKVEEKGFHLQYFYIFSKNRVHSVESQRFLLARIAHQKCLIWVFLQIS